VASQETGGTMSPAAHAATVQEITEARTKQLHAALKNQQQRASGENKAA